MQVIKILALTFYLNEENLVNISYSGCCFRSYYVQIKASGTTKEYNCHFELW